MEELVDKTLESKSGELFKKILDIVDNMLHPPEPHPPNDTGVLNSSHQPTGISTLSDPTPPTSVAGAVNTFELPIDLLSFSSGSSSSNLKKEGIKKIAGKGKSKPNEGATISGKELQRKAGKIDLPGGEGLLSIDKEKIKKQKMEKTDTHEKENLETLDTQAPSSNEGREKEENIIEKEDNAQMEPTLLDTKKDLTLLENKAEDAFHTGEEEESEEEKETEADKEKGVEDRNNGIEDVFEDENSPPLSNSRPRRSARLASQQQQEEEKEEGLKEEEEEEKEESKEMNHEIEEKEEEMEQEEEEKNKNERTRKRKKRISQSEQDEEEEEEEEKGRRRHPRKKQRLQPVRSSGRVKKRLLSSTSSEDKQSHDESHVSSSKKSDSPQPMSPSVKERRRKVASRGSKTEDKIESEDEFDDEPKRIETKGRRSKRSRNKQ